MTEKGKTGRKAKGAADNAGFQKVRAVSLDDNTVDVLRTVGKGNLSAGIREAAGIIRTIRAIK